MRCSFAALFTCLLVCAAAFPQNNATIYCDPASMTSVPAWSSPGKPHVAEQLPCGEPVRVLGIESSRTLLEYSSRPQDYAKIQLRDKVVYVDAKFVKMSEDKETAPLSKPEINTPKKQSAEGEEEQKKWSLIKKEDLKLRDEFLLKPIVITGPRTFASTVTNNSHFTLSQIQLLIRIYDCSGPHKSDYSNCEIIGEAKSTAATSVPASQTRRVTAEALFENAPRVKGTFAWNYWITGIRAE